MNDLARAALAKAAELGKPSVYHSSLLKVHRNAAHQRTSVDRRDLRARCPDSQPALKLPFVNIGFWPHAASIADNSIAALPTQ